MGCIIKNFSAGLIVGKLDFMFENVTFGCQFQSLKNLIPD